jgi:hypothetical protein
MLNTIARLLLGKENVLQGYWSSYYILRGKVQRIVLYVP